MFTISPSARIRSSPFYAQTIAEGVVSMTVYNNMLMPTSYGDPAAEYDRLLSGVSMWDVSVERQVELTGPDAGRLAQILAPRDLAGCKVGQGKYVPICNHRGMLLNDPILMKLADDRYWLSIADSNMWFWADAIARERGLDVTVGEPDVSPLAVQGPLAETVVAGIFGDWVRDLRYFWFREAEVEGIPVIVARSGWSKQGGFEIYLCDGTRGADLWRIVKEAGAPHGIGPGNPNWIERIESGLLSWGGDTDGETSPFEVRMGKYVDLGVPDDTVGIEALRRIAAAGAPRHQLGVVLDGGERAGPAFRWNAIERDGQKVGDLTNCTWSGRIGANIGFALISTGCRPGDRVVVQRPEGPQPGTLCDLPFL